MEVVWSSTKQLKRITAIKITTENRTLLPEKTSFVCFPQWEQESLCPGHLRRNCRYFAEQPHSGQGGSPQNWIFFFCSMTLPFHTSRYSAVLSFFILTSVWKKIHLPRFPRFFLFFPCPSSHTPAGFPLENLESFLLPGKFFFPGRRPFPGGASSELSLSA